ncbi:MAG: hypothetical protein KGH98_05175 [Candidatus Micrarchaeota archaeon]|nr:hypothetical protein [Candidatus Micrarchaeota archaeon]
MSQPKANQIKAMDDERNAILKIAANMYGKASVPISRFSSVTMYGLETVDRHLVKLEKDGFLTIKRRDADSNGEDTFRLTDSGMALGLAIRAAVILRNIDPEIGEQSAMFIEYLMGKLRLKEVKGKSDLSDYGAFGTNAPDGY